MVKKLQWYEIVIQTSHEAQDAIANILNENGAGGVVIEDSADLNREYRPKFGEIYELNKEKYQFSGVIIKAYYNVSENWPELKDRLLEKISELSTFGINIGDYNVSIQTVKETDWENEWKKYFKPLEVGNRFLIIPEWEMIDEANTDKLLIRIDPGMAFGTGTHETTSLSITALEKVIQEGDEVIDVGSGSGILSIAACLLGAERVYSYDLDEVAVSSTISNRELNQLSDKIIAEQNHLLKNKRHKANVIVANILTHILIDLVEDAWQQLVDGGYFVTSGIIVSQEHKLTDKLLAQGFTTIERLEENKWVTLIAKK